MVTIEKVHTATFRRPTVAKRTNSRETCADHCRLARTRVGLVREYLARGWHVTATARKPSDELVALHRDADGRLVIESLEVTLIAQIAALTARLKGQSFDLLFLNPGIMAGFGAALSDVPDGWL